MPSVLLSALLFGLGAPLAKILLRDVHPLALAGILYLGAFIGLTAYRGLRRMAGASPPSALRLSRRDLPWLIGAVLLGGIAAPICLMIGLARLSGITASLLLNLEGAATAFFAVVLFHENAGRRIWFAIVSMAAAGVVLSWDPTLGAFSWAGALLILAAMAGWGLDNNFTRRICHLDGVRLAQIKGLVAGMFSTGAAFVLGIRPSWNWPTAAGLAVGAFCYGLSLVLFIRALAGLGALRTGTVFGASPFIGAIASIIILREPLAWSLVPGGMLMLAGVALIARENHEHLHRHFSLRHDHEHDHADLHHRHVHDSSGPGRHIHDHVHEEIEHAHPHRPDLHHRHPH